ncbi:MAG: Non-specific serine/threonine protein kinase [Acidobacteriota bacterium]|nr:Non-specific serine/threonine protein kinase [Acidobacteriota bacterium]
MVAVERWARLKELFFEALELSDAERPAFAARLPAADCDLAPTLQAMLAAHSSGSDGFTADIGVAREQALADAERPTGRFDPGRRIGGYEIVRLLGEGGMGAVFLARRTDPQFQQLVAIKLVRSALPSAVALARFVGERQTLAQLAHPNIARLLDGGSTEEGLPYLVLEFVEGLPIDRFVDERGLTLEARLDLILAVAAGVEHAHGHLVVHRDLKPGNILVTGDGVPKLLDFGIAKLLGDDEAEPERRTSTRVLTPAWASPEQILGRPITTATDVHALGLLLYRLLAGAHPFERDEGNAIATARAICELEPVKPSLAAVDPALGRCLAGDLDTIVLRALAKEPQRRYPSVTALVDDLRRYRAGLPVLAHPDSPGYRARKFVARHRLVVAAGAAVVLALVGGATVAVVQAAEARRERDRARVGEERAERMNAFLRSVLAAPDPVRGGERDLRVADLLAGASRRLESELGGQPAIACDLRATLGETYYNLGRLEEAESELDRALELARGSGRSARSTAPIELARAKTLNGLGRWSEAESDLRATLARLDPATESTALRGALLDVLAVALQNQGRKEEAIAVGREAVALLRNASSERAALASALNNLAIALGNAGELAAAEALHREAVEIARRTYGERHPSVAEALANLAGVLDIEGKFAEAEPIYRQALTLQEELLGERHFDFVRTLTSYANLLWLMKRPADALPVARRAQALAAAAHGDDHHLTAYAENILGGVLLDLGESAEAERHIRSALEKRRQLLPAGHWLIASAQSNLGAALLGQDRLSEAERELRAAHAALLADRGAEHEKTKLTAERLAELEQRRGRG